MRRHLAKRMTSAGDLQFGPHNQRMAELTQLRRGAVRFGTHGGSRNGSPMRRDEVHQTKTDRFDALVCRNATHVTDSTRRFNQNMNRQRRYALACLHSIINDPGSLVDFCRRLDLRQHHVRQMLARTTDDNRYILCKSRMIHGVNANRHAPRRLLTGHRSAVEDVIDQCRHHFSMATLAADRRTVFTVKCHVKNTGTELLRHLRLKRETFDHARFNTTVMVADRQAVADCSTQQNVAGMGHSLGPAKPSSEQMGNAGLLFL